MRSNTPARRALNAAAAEWREELRNSVGRCEFCGQWVRALSVHEVARGNGIRPKALRAEYAVLVLCVDLDSACHRTLERLAGDDQRALGLALLRRSRPEDYDLERFYRLTARRFPSAELVELWRKRLAWIGAS
jgi:hypothetical protein